jgi:hypothetical protein
VGRWPREPGTDLLEERHQRFFAVVELVVAHGHGVELHLIEEFGFNRALVGGVEQRALEVVTAIEQENVLAFEFLALFGNRRDQARGTADALAFALFFGGAGRFKLVVALNAAVPVIDMHDGQRIVGE